LGDYLRGVSEPEPERGAGRFPTTGRGLSLFDIGGHPCNNSLIRSGERLE
jgi:hypothetical protein